MVAGAIVRSPCTWLVHVAVVMSPTPPSQERFSRHGTPHHQGARTLCGSWTVHGHSDPNPQTEAPRPVPIDTQAPTHPHRSLAGHWLHRRADADGGPNAPTGSPGAPVRDRSLTSGPVTDGVSAAPGGRLTRGPLSGRLQKSNSAPAEACGRRHRPITGRPADSLRQVTDASGRISARPPTGQPRPWRCTRRSTPRRYGRPAGTPSPARACVRLCATYSLTVVEHSLAAGCEIAVAIDSPGLDPQERPGSPRPCTTPPTSSANQRRRCHLLRGSRQLHDALPGEPRQRGRPGVLGSQDRRKVAPVRAEDTLLHVALQRTATQSVLNLLYQRLGDAEVLRRHATLAQRAPGYPGARRPSCPVFKDSIARDPMCFGERDDMRASTSRSFASHAPEPTTAPPLGHAGPTRSTPASEQSKLS